MWPQIQHELAVGRWWTHIVAVDPAMMFLPVAFQL